MGYAFWGRLGLWSLNFYANLLELKGLSEYNIQGEFSLIRKPLLGIFI